MKMSDIIKARKVVEKARKEYHSFMSVRELKDIMSSYDLMGTMIILEDRLVKARNKLDEMLDSVT